jgi:hypothetical protein
VRLSMFIGLRIRRGCWVGSEVSAQAADCGGCVCLWKLFVYLYHGKFSREVVHGVSRGTMSDF